MKRYTAAELAFIKRRRKMPRGELLLVFWRKFRRRGMTLPRLQDLCNRNGWGVGSRKGRGKGRSKRYSKAELSFVKRRRRWERTKIQAAFVEQFRRSDVTCNMIRQLCQRNRWLTDPRDRHCRNKGRSLKYSKEELAFLSRRRRLARRELHAKFVQAFPRHRAVSQDAIHALCLLHGWQTGRDGGFEKGQVPANKGKKMPFNPNSARTQFKKGQLPRNAKHLGHEYIDKDGYVLISVAETNPHTGFERRYVFKQRWLWEEKHGPIPKGMVLKCKGDKSNTDPSNWELVSRAVLARLNQSRNRYETAPAELKPAIMAIAKLRDRIGDKRRGAR